MSDKKSKKKKQMVNKAKKIRSIVMMSLMCIMLLSAATYAWFSLSNSAKMSNLTMTVGEAKGLQVAEDTGGSAPDKESNVWKSSFSLVDGKMKGKLMPATFDGIKFYKPKYDDNGNVDGVADMATDGSDKLKYPNDTESATGYYYEVTFYMMSKGADSNICLVKGDGSSKGTYVVNDTQQANSATKNAEAAIRIAISADTAAGATYGGQVVYEPNSDITFTGAKATTKSGYNDGKKYTGTTVKQTSTGEFETGTDGNSSKIFTLKADTPTKITLSIWIEGDDNECVNEIATDNLKGQLQFEQMS